MTLTLFRDSGSVLDSGQGPYYFLKTNRLPRIRNTDLSLHSTVQYTQSTVQVGSGTVHAGKGTVHAGKGTVQVGLGTVQVRSSTFIIQYRYGQVQVQVHSEYSTGTVRYRFKCIQSKV